jgi:tRNA A-37 threonylcarbamoyl transferase component Bud32
MCDLALSLETISLAIKEVVEGEFKKMTSPQMYDISSPQMSDAEIATLHLKDLSKKMPTFAMPPTDGPPVCTEDDWNHLIGARNEAKAFEDITSEEKLAISHESYLCWQMTPYLQALFEQIGIVVNSEDYKWVRTYSGEQRNYMKPDFFVTLKGLMASRDSSGLPYTKALRDKTESVEYDFGEMLWEIRDCMRVLIEFKNKLSPEHFGKVVIYLQHLSRDSQGCMYYGMLCDDTDIILVSCCDSMVCSRYELKWTSPGSQAFIRNFVYPQNRWMQLLNLSMSHFGVQLQGDRAFLGMGKNGRVFRVQEEGRVLALKIVLSPDDGLAQSVFAEHRTLRDFKSKKLPVVTVLEDEAFGVYAEGDDHCLGVCYLMKEVGTPITVKNADELRAVFMLLFALHSQNEFHGDPRLTNIICFEGELLWIDFFKLHVSTSSQDFMKINFERDIKTLTGSVSKFCTVRKDDSLAFDTLVSTYAIEPSQVHLDNILRMLSEINP